ncbi:MAG TPA: M3 family metallopeptidase [Burkholderiaceae bacterium]|nr:M3 family metallopeptidase [Burkholderiaceae bacterium]
MIVSRAAAFVAAVVVVLALAVPPPAQAARPRHPAKKPAKVLPVVDTGLPGPPFPRFDTVAQVDAACQAGLEGAQARVKGLEASPPGLPWLRGWDALYGWQEDQSGALLVLKNVHPDPAIRAATLACEAKWQAFQSALGLDEKIYDIGRRSTFPDPIDRRTAQVALEGFEDSGVSLPPAKRGNAKDITDKLAELTQAFERNIVDSRVHASYAPPELKGVPESLWKDRARDAEGRITLGVDDPTYFAVMQGAEDAEARERMYRAKLGQGGADNLKTLQQIEQLRLEYAKLFGYASYADFLLRRRMAENTGKVTKFLDDVQAAVADEEKREIVELRQLKARELRQPLDAVKLERWDILYYTQLARREKFALDDEAFRPYFPPQESLRFVMRIAEKLFGIRYDRVPGTFWAPDVQAYAITDLATHKRIASLFIDPYPREGKYNHAAVWSYRNAATSESRAPQAVLVVNLDRNGLTLAELATLLHEFGHTLHSDLSATRYASVGGTNVQQDFVEAPSQMLESWVYDKRVLKVFQEVCPACKPVPDDLVERAKAARDYDKGLYFARQHLYASFDLALHGPAAPDPMELWNRMEAGTPLGGVPGTMFPAGFAHIAGNYGAGYYGYLWSLMVATDMRTAFSADKLDPKVGQRYRADVLSQGGQKLPQQLVRDFLGREPSTQAFFDSLRK